MNKQDWRYYMIAETVKLRNRAIVVGVAMMVLFGIMGA